MALRLGSIVDALGGELHGNPDVQIEDWLRWKLRKCQPELSQQSQVPAATGRLEGGLCHRGARHAGGCPDARRLHCGGTALPVFRASHAALEAPACCGGRHRDPSQCRGRSVGASWTPARRIGALCVVERGARIGAGTVLKSRVTVGEDCVIGERCILHPGVVMGADGFGFAPHDGAWEKIEQLGAVRIGNDVEIGANTCIDRGALQDTVIEDGVKLDNLIQIGHNVHIGKHTAMAGCVGVAGSAVIGAHCTFGGARHGAGASDHCRPCAYFVGVDGYAAPSSSPAITLDCFPSTTMRPGRKMPQR